jgi:hypothetical protein
MLTPARVRFPFRLRVLLPAALVLLASPVPAARAQQAAAPGSVTMLSRPAGVGFRLAGEEVVSGRTPMTLQRGLSGRYRVTGFERGFESWKRRITLDGGRADTVWMTLRPKSALLAGARSLLVPGWGQFYSDHPARGLVCMAAAVGAGVTLAVFADRYRQRVDEYDAADARYKSAGTLDALTATFAERQWASRRAEDAYDLRQIAFGAACGVWGVSLLDAAFSVEPGRAPVRLGLRRTRAGDPQLALAARAGF